MKTPLSQRISYALNNPAPEGDGGESVQSLLDILDRVEDEMVPKAEVDLLLKQVSEGLLSKVKVLDNPVSAGYINAAAVLKAAAKEVMDHAYDTQA